MVRFDDLRLRDGPPIYLQIMEHLKAGIAAGTVQDGDELPSRRTLSALLGVNPNTIQKAFRLLEDEGLISSRSGAKSEISLTPGRVEDIRRQLLEQEAGLLVRSLRQAGLEKADAFALLDRLWEESKEDGS